MKIITIVVYTVCAFSFFSLEASAKTFRKPSSNRITCEGTADQWTQGEGHAPTRAPLQKINLEKRADSEYFNGEYGNYSIDVDLTHTGSATLIIRNALDAHFMATAAGGLDQKRTGPTLTVQVANDPKSEFKNLSLVLKCQAAK